MSDGLSILLSQVGVGSRRHPFLRVDHLQVTAGECVGIIGPNGAGKTTLLKLCCGLIRPNRGTVLLDGRPVGGWRGWRGRQDRRIGYIPQQTEYNSHLPFSLRDVMAMGRNALKPALRPLDRSDFEAVDHWIAELGLYDRRHQTFRSLSGGQQQKALIARAMVAAPRLVILDEPAANLDTRSRGQLRDIMERLFRDRAMTVLLVSHDVEFLPHACRRLLLLRQGRIEVDGPRDEVLASPSAADVLAEI